MKRNYIAINGTGKVKTEKRLSQSKIREINKAPDRIEEGDKVNLLKQMMLWHKLSTLERTTVLKNEFASEIARDNYTQKLILKYL